MTQTIKIFLTFAASLVITLLVLPRLAHIASYIGLIDNPGKRKVHKNPKPLIGGIGIMIGISVSLLMFAPFHNLRGFYAGLLLLAIIGFLDDFRELHHSWKFAAQIVAVLFMIYLSNTILHSFGDLLSFGSISFNRASIFLTVFSTVGVINAINMIDGVDGLAGGVSLVAFISFSFLAYISNRTELMLLSLAFSGALIAFLRYNWHPSSLFMGDAGSLTLGFTLTFLSIALTQGKNSLIPPVAPLMILTVPIADTLTIMTKRMMKGRSPFHADKAHLHHILLRFGLSKRRTSGVIILSSALFSSIAILGTMYKTPEYYLFSVFMAYFIIYFISSFYIKKMLRRIKKVGSRL
ncbi:MAG: MraY family glycosyltransferase [Nitrospirota bacterium]